MISIMASYPLTRLRRLRMQPFLRSMLREVNLHPSDLIWPIFIVDGENQRQPVHSMPGVERLSIDQLLIEVREAVQLGIVGVALFPQVSPAQKTPNGDEALNPENLMCRAIRAIKSLNLPIAVIADVALDPYTDHGHDGVIINNQIANDASVDRLVEQAWVQAQAGCDILAPSDMQDGRIGAIRQRLESEGMHDVCLLSYAAKYASCFYGPFRDAIGSSSSLGKASKSTYQQDYANVDEALREVQMDIDEGADMVMIKPGMPYLDVLSSVKANFGMPTFGYQVSGEYSMIYHLANGEHQVWVNTMTEALYGFKRAGADGIFTYAAKVIAETLCKSSGQN